MAKFHLHTERLLQGKFELKEINLAFIFQVNCPGCFMYGIPMVNTMYEKFFKDVGFIGISTAFEDFELNTKETTELLLKDQFIVGETRKYYFENFGTYKYDHKLQFPVAFDKVMDALSFLSHDNIELICNTNPNYSIWPEWEKRAMHERIIQYYKQAPLVAPTFTLNQLQGTPSFVMFDKNYNKLQTFFGYQKLDLLDSELTKYTSQ